MKAVGSVAHILAGKVRLSRACGRSAQGLRPGPAPRLCFEVTEAQPAQSTGLSGASSALVSPALPSADASCRTS